MQKPEFKILNRLIGENHPPVVIAEIGINHGGSIDLAIHMVDDAIKNGAEIIKHQTHVVDDEMASEAKKVIPSHTKESIFDIMKSCALNEEEEMLLKKHVESKGVIFISTPFSRAAAERLKKMDIPAYKIGSGECNNYPLLKHVASFGKPIILSTGMNTIDSIRPAVQIFRNAKIPYALLHCTNVYPTPNHLVRLGAIEQLKTEFPDAVVGLSDHTLSNYPCLGAVALGASILERHYTDTRERQGPDIICSMDGQDLKELIKGSQIIFEARGGQKGPIAEEQGTINFAFASVVSIKKINKGEQFTTENLWVKRPGTGDFLAKDYEALIGKKAACDIAPDQLLKKNDVEGTL